MNSLQAAVVGLGQIGLGYDYNSNTPDTILTHSSAFHWHPAYTLVAGVDPDAKACERFTKKFSIPAFTSVEKLCLELSPEIIALSVPTPLHGDAYWQIVANCKPRAIIFEKPISFSLEEAEQIVADAQSRGIELLVNYQRRFLPAVHEFKQRFEKNEFGEIYKGVVWYSKGLSNNASHFIDLLQFLFGKAELKNIVSKGRVLGQDIEPDFSLSFPGMDIIFLAGREENFSIFEIELLASKAKIRFSGERFQYWPSTIDPLFPDYTILSPIGKEISGEVTRHQWYVADALAKSLLHKNALLPSTGKTALDTLRLIEQIKVETGAILAELKD